jgi:hypothetical protein
LPEDEPPDEGAPRTSLPQELPPPPPHPPPELLEELVRVDDVVEARDREEGESSSERVPMLHATASTGRTETRRDHEIRIGILR